MPQEKKKTKIQKIRFHAKLTFRRHLKHYKELIKTDSFGKRYVIFAAAVLAATTVFWGILSASLHNSNADQIVDSYLFEDSKTFNGATFPISHSFLLKWPLFFFINRLGVSSFSLSLFTVLVSLATVLFLAYIIYRIERRLLYFGTLYLALASVLLLIPIQPYAGGLLPVNMAMVTTRNLEYIFYLTSLVLLIRSPRIKSLSFWLATGLLSLLIASDRLFLILSLGGAFLALIAYGFSRRQRMVELSRKWFLSGAVAVLVATLIAWIINLSGVTHIAGQPAVGPFGLVHSLKGIILGFLYGILGLFTNFGANPAYDATIVRNIPGQIFSRLFDWGGFAYVVNIAILVIGVFASLKILVLGSTKNKSPDIKIDKSSQLSTMLIWSTLAALIAFILTDHYYAVDARYLTIGMFAGFVSIATFLRRKNLQPFRVFVIGVVIVLSAVFGLVGAIKSYNSEKIALSSINERNSRVASAISHHKTVTLVGDYWRVVPIKLMSQSSLRIMPFASCADPLTTLSSKAWQSDLKKTSFAYLLSYDRGLSSYQNCTLDQIISTYGRPNSSSLIAGTINSPKEQVLYYDKGINKNPKTVNRLSRAPSTVLPIPLSRLPNVNCAGPTIMNIVAHQDDDLLFMSPDLLHAIQAGYCVRTVYVTAGDAGDDQYYWLSRELGSETAYDYMDGPSKDIWIKRIASLSNDEFIEVDNPRGNSKISLIFMHLPDGNTDGSGFKVYHYESLARLEAGKIITMRSVDNQSSYTSNQFINGLATLMSIYQPSEIRTQANFVSKKYPDHSDHMAVGRYVKKAHQIYDAGLAIKFYIGYPIAARPTNVFGRDLEETQTAFFAYAKFDSAVCSSVKNCQKSKASYGLYLDRQYQNPE